MAHSFMYAVLWFIQQWNEKKEKTKFEREKTKTKKKKKIVAPLQHSEMFPVRMTNDLCDAYGLKMTK